MLFRPPPAVREAIGGHKVRIRSYDAWIRRAAEDLVEDLARMRPTEAIKPSRIIREVDRVPGLQRLHHRRPYRASFPGDVAKRYEAHGLQGLTVQDCD